MKRSIEKGKLYLIPGPLGEGGLSAIPDLAQTITNDLKDFIVEREKTARAILKRFKYPHSFDDANLYPIDKRTTLEEIFGYVQLMVNGKSVGLLSEAGAPCVADPGAQVVDLAHQYGIKVIPLVGPCSILLALMASGMQGQSFTFWGYLPIDSRARKQKILQLEQLSTQQDQTQIFIETPYRNHKLLDDIKASCRHDTRLCVACNLTLPNEHIVSQPIAKWKKTKYNFHKKPAVFLLYHS